MTASILEWLKALGPPLTALSLFVLTWFYNRWQVRLAKQKLHHDLYDRRFAIYVAFRELLLALPEKHDEEIKEAFRKANLARFEAMFLFGSDPTYRGLKDYLNLVCQEVQDNVIANIMLCDGYRKAGYQSDPGAVAQFAAAASRLGPAKLEIANRHFDQITKQFSRFLRLTDFET